MKKMVTLLITVAMILTMAVPAFANEDIAAAATKPSKVQDVKVLKNGYRSLKVTWRADPAATKYQVYRATKKTGKYVLKKTTASTSYTNTGITCGKTYYYKVRAINAKGNGTFSTVKSSKVIPATVKITKVRPPKDDMVRVYWNKVSGATGYQVYRKRTDKTTWKHFKTVSSKYTYATDQLLGNKSYPWGKYGPVYYDYKDMEYSWDYKVRAYRTVNGKRVYGYFSAPNKWVPDWTIEEVFKECWEYGESLKFPVYDYANPDGSLNENGEYLVPKKDGSKYNLKHIIGWNNSGDVWGDASMVYTNPANGNTQIPSKYKAATPKNSSWSPIWPVLVNPYRTKKSVMKDLREGIRVELREIASANPLFWDTLGGAAGPNGELEYWNGAQEFTIYHEKYLNGYKVWLLW